MKNNKCYGYDDELNICLLYGVPCNSDTDIECYHLNKDEYSKKREEGIIK